MLWFSQALASAGGPNVYERGLDDPAFVKAFEVMENVSIHTTSDAVGADAGVSGGHFLSKKNCSFHEWTLVHHSLF